MAFGVFDSQGMFLDSDFDQRSNLFYIKCLVNNKWCSLKIDSGSCHNLVSIETVSKLGLTVVETHNPYNLHGLNLEDCFSVSGQVRVGLSMGLYMDEITFDVVPMGDCHFVLGRPWIFDLDVSYRGRANEYEFVVCGKTIVLKPMSSNALQVMLANNRMKLNVEALESDSRIAETDCGMEKENGVVGLSKPWYDPDFSLDVATVSYIEPIHDGSIDSGAVFGGLSNVSLDNSITEICSEDYMMRPIWDDEMSDDFSFTNDSIYFGESCDVSAGPNIPRLVNEKWEPDGGGVSVKEKAVGVHTLLIVKTVHENFFSDFYNSCNVLSIDKSLFDGVVVIGKDELSGHGVEQFSEIFYQHGVAGKISLGTDSRVGYVGACSGFNTGVILVEPEISNSNYGLGVGGISCFGADCGLLFCRSGVSESFGNNLESKKLENGVSALWVSNNPTSLGLESVISEFGISHTGLNFDASLISGNVITKSFESYFSSEDLEVGVHSWLVPNELRDLTMITEVFRLFAELYCRGDSMLPHMTSHTVVSIFGANG